MKLLGYTIQRRVSGSRFKKRLSFLRLFEYYYHVESPRQLVKSILDDIVVSAFMGAGSGLFGSIFRGIYFKLFVNYRYPALIGKWFKIIGRSNVNIGKVFWAKEGVTLFAGGPLTIGNSCVLCERATIWSGSDGVSIGNNCALGVGSYIFAIKGKVSIGDDVMIADNVRFYPWDHKFSKGSKPFSEMDGEVREITIGNNCWLGTGCIILAGVKIGNNCVIAAGSVVTKSFLDDSLIAGVPAKIIRQIK